VSGFIIKPFIVSVDGYGQSGYHARSRGKALADAWRCDAFDHLTFKGFLKIARCRLVDHNDPRFGDPITVNGRPAFFVENDRQYVRMAWPGSDHVSNAHPLEVKPIEYRPDTYRSEKFDAQ
jgi:hypothetical protein